MNMLCAGLLCFAARALENEKPCKHEFTGHLQVCRGGSKVAWLLMQHLCLLWTCHVPVCHVSLPVLLRKKKTHKQEFTRRLRGHSGGSKVA